MLVFLLISHWAWFDIVHFFQDYTQSIAECYTNLIL